MNRILVLMILVFGARAVGQDTKVTHALTVEQCRADRDKWRDDISTAWLNKTEASLPTFSVLRNESEQLGTCRIQVDKDSSLDSNAIWDSYTAAIDAISTEMHVRERHFLERHGLMNKFSTEDSEGKR
jgi:hypothetical protein